MGCRARLPTPAWSRIGRCLRMSADVHWLLVYVVLSRTRSLNSLMSFDFSDTLREVVERGPPDNFVGSFDRLFGDKVQSTRQAAREARRHLGWN